MQLGSKSQTLPRSVRHRGKRPFESLKPSLFLEPSPGSGPVKINEQCVVCALSPLFPLTSEVLLTGQDLTCLSTNLRRRPETRELARPHTLNAEDSPVRCNSHWTDRTAGGGPPTPCPVSVRVKDTGNVQNVISPKVLLRTLRFSGRGLWQGQLRQMQGRTCQKSIPCGGPAVVAKGETGQPHWFYQQPASMLEWLWKDKGNQQLRPESNQTRAPTRAPGLRLLSGLHTQAPEEKAQEP